MQPITITSYNIHKGMSMSNRAVQLVGMSKALMHIRPDVLCLQEVQAQNLKRAMRVADFPSEPQHEWLARRLGMTACYGKNAKYPHGHHGNAVLSYHRLKFCHNLDITVNRLESRGVLHCQIQPEGWEKSVIVLCCHLNLLQHDRLKQYQAIGEYLQTLDQSVPLILAGDFNDWSKKSCEILACHGLSEVFVQTQSAYPATFPAKLPLLSLDRIYVRHLTVQGAMVHTGTPWANLSDHLPISAVLSLA